MGLYVDRDVNQNQHIVLYTGKIRDSMESHDHTPDGSNDVAVSIDAINAVIDPSDCGNNARYANHSCEANAELREVSIGGATLIAIRAKKFIPFGTEVTVNYGYNSLQSQYVLLCECGSKNCKDNV